MFLELARNFALIDNDKHQEALSQMARALAAAQSQSHQRDRETTAARSAQIWCRSQNLRPPRRLSRLTAHSVISPV